jgi:DNA-binding NtrC family response regulator
VSSKEATGRVLVVDSDPYRRTFLVQMLMEAGRRVLMAGTGAEARAMLSSLGPRVEAVIVSPALADTSGPELVQELRAERPGQRFVLIANEPSEPTIAGVERLIRPITSEKLAALLG